MEETKTEIQKPKIETEQAVSVDHLYHSYPGSFMTAIEVESFGIREGEAILVTGKSGSGKSTLVNCINGVIPHVFPGITEIDPQTHRGEVYVYGMPVSKTPLAKLSTTVGTLLQDPETQVLNYKVEEEVAFGPENLCMTPEEISKRVSEAIDVVGIRGLLERETYTLSGGELQRVAMAAVLAMRPRILILDEPTSNIDPQGTEEVFELMRKMKGKTMIVVEHKVERVLPFVDRIVLVDKGEIVFDLEKEKILDHLDELMAAGVEVPEHYVVAKQLGITSTDLDKVVLEAKRRGLKLPKPERYRASEEIMNASAVVSSAERTILDASLALGKGEVLAIMGRNGAGKSTLLKALVGFTDRKLNVQLSLKVAGTDLSTSRIQERGRYLAFVPQNFDLTLVSKTVYEELAYSPKKHKVK
ncbi:MAG: ATP-binding cassette domain-containing protein, partial [Thermoprotei archaeon]